MIKTREKVSKLKVENMFNEVIFHFADYSVVYNCSEQL